jgi:hypothetical protein
MFIGWSLKCDKFTDDRQQTTDDGRQVKAIKRTNKHTPKKKTGDEIMCFKIKYDKLEKVDLVITDTF